jgi:hypothetical protein
MSEAKASFTFSADEFLALFGRFATSPSTAFLQIEASNFVVQFTVRDLKISVRIPTSANIGFVGNRCFLISAEILFSYFKLAQADQVNLRYEPSELDLGTVSQFEVSTDREKVLWPATSAELIAHEIDFDGQPFKPDKLAHAIEFVGQFVSVKSENRLKSDVLVFDGSVVWGARTNSTVILQHEAIQPFVFFMDRMAALALRATLRTLLPGKSLFWTDGSSKYKISDGRLCCEFQATPTSSKNVKSFVPTLKVEGAQLNFAATAAIKQGGRGGTKSFTINFEKREEDIFLVFEVHVPGAPVTKQGLARAKCKVSIIDPVFDYAREQILLTGPEIQRIGTHPGTVEISIADEIGFKEVSDEETITAGFSRRRGKETARQN